jgi:SpoVK/Ycf46/Vps4 family AAA+-type ATPase
VQSAHDKYANQEVSYLLQRVEDYPGLLILASNFKNNLDEAFIRRFHSLIYFPMPNAGDRLTLWRKSLPTRVKHDASINLTELAKLYEMSGAAILNAVQFSALQVYARGNGILTQSDLLDGIRKEYLKEEKSI